MGWAHSAAASWAASDSTEEAGPWLPVPEEDLESLEGLEEEAGVRAGVLVRSALTRGHVALRRVAIDLNRGNTAAEAATLVEDGRYHPGGRIALGRDGFVAAGGRISLARLPPLFAEAMGLSRAGRRVPSPRAGVLDAAPSRGASAGSLDGGALTRGGGKVALWSFAGARDGETKVGWGAALALDRETRLALALGSSRHGSLTLQHRKRGQGASLELLAGERDRGFLAEAVTRAEGIVLGARWRYRSWADRPVGAEATVETAMPGSRARLTWRSWSSAAARDDGWLELEWSGGIRGVAPIKVRLGSTSVDAPERYGLVDATLARDSGRSLSMHALRRTSSAAGSASSTTLGTRLDLRGRLGAQAIVVETTKLRRGGAAWGVALAPSGDVTLRSRSKPGLWVSARGSVGTGPWRLGYQLERGEDVAGPKPWGGSLWLRRSGG